MEEEEKEEEEERAAGVSEGPLLEGEGRGRGEERAGFLVPAERRRGEKKKEGEES